MAAKYLKTPLNITRRIRRILAVAGFRDADKPVGKRGPKRQALAPIRGNITVAREKGKGMHRVSVRDFHSFRVTWVTLALTAGVPLELVQKVTGHKTTDIVLKHYFQPGREAFRDTLQRAMPNLLMGGAVRTEPKKSDISDQMMAIVDAAKPKTAMAALAALRPLIEQMRPTKKSAV